MLMMSDLSLVVQAQVRYVPAASVVMTSPGNMVGRTNAINPPLLKGIKVFPEEPFRFEFLLDPGQESLTDDELQTQSNRLIRYFLASLTIPEDEMWVNLSPYESERIITASFGVTEMGRDLLAEDYLLKQMTASLMYPESETGSAFWDKVRQEARARFGVTDVPVETFNKVWIVPDDALVYENDKTATAYVLESRMKVLLENDYLAAFKNQTGDDAESDAMSAQIVREIIIPVLEHEVNHGAQFVKLRQVYNSLILASWYKRKIQSGIIDQIYVNQKKTEGVDIENPDEKMRIYQQYLEAFEQGVYNYVKDEYDPVSQQIVPRKYFSGGVGFNKTNLSKAMRFTNRLSSVVSATLLSVGIFLSPAVKAEEGATMQQSEQVEARLREALEPVMEERRQETINDNIETSIRVFPFYKGFEDELDIVVFERTNGIKDSLGFDWVDEVSSQFPFLIDVEGNIAGRNLQENKEFMRNLPTADVSNSLENQKILRYYHMAALNVYANLFGLDAKTYRKEMSRAMGSPEIKDMDVINADHEYKYDRRIFKSDMNLFPGIVAHEVAHNLSELAFTNGKFYADAIMAEFTADVMGIAVIEQVYGEGKEYNKFTKWQTMMVRVAEPFNFGLRIKSLFNPWLSSAFSVPRSARKGHHYFARTLGVVLRRAAGDDFDTLRFAQAVNTIEAKMKTDAGNKLRLEDQTFGGVALVADVSEVFSAIWTEYSGVDTVFDKKYIEVSMIKSRVRVSPAETLQQALSLMGEEGGGIVVLPVFPDQWQTEADNAVLNEMFEDVDPAAFMEYMRSFNDGGAQVSESDELINRRNFADASGMDDAIMNQSGANRSENVGGIDFDPSTLNLRIQNEGRAIEMNMDNIDLKLYQNAGGFTPVIINIQPVINLPLFLGYAGG